MDGIHKSYHTGLGRHDHGVRPDAASKVPDPMQGFTRRNARRRKYHVFAPYQVVQGQLLLRIIEAVLLELLNLRTLGGPHLGLNLPSETFYNGRGQYALGSSPDTNNSVQLRPVQAHGDGRRQVALLADLNSRTGLPYLLDEVLVPGSVQHRHGYLRGSPAVRFGNGAYVLVHRRVDVDSTSRARTHDELAHIHVRHPEHAPAR